MKNTYRVEIVETATQEVVAVIGEKLSKERAEKRLETGVLKTDIGSYFIRIVKE